MTSAFVSGFFVFVLDVCPSGSSNKGLELQANYTFNDTFKGKHYILTGTICIIMTDVLSLHSLAFFLRKTALRLRLTISRISRYRQQ